MRSRSLFRYRKAVPLMAHKVNYLGEGNYTLPFHFFQNLQKNSEKNTQKNTKEKKYFVTH